ncbi:hypothetical protein PMI40_01530 [Herbaspirillum sp. YR522]|nr:hypothetical protein PMI40_01530 [Herbaspirillum sp. YR522]
MALCQLPIHDVLIKFGAELRGSYKNQRLWGIDMIEKTSSALHMPTQQPASAITHSGGINQRLTKLRALTSKTFLVMGVAIAGTGMAVLAGLVYYGGPDPLAPTWGYPGMLLGALMTVAGAIMMARGVHRQCLLGDDQEP